MAPTKLDPDTHVQDSDCVIDSMTGLCLICGVDHSEPCMVCGGRGFHKPLCPLRGDHQRLVLAAGTSGRWSGMQ